MDSYNPFSAGGQYKYLRVGQDPKAVLQILLCGVPVKVKELVILLTYPYTFTCGINTTIKLRFNHVKSFTGTTL